MKQLYRVTFLPDDITIKVKQGTSVLTAAQMARVPIRTRCGGRAACFACKIRLEDAMAKQIEPMNAKEARKWGVSPRSLTCDGQRLACQSFVKGDLNVIVPEDPLKAAIRKKLADQGEEDFLW